MVGQAVGATGESPKDDRQDAGPTQDARRHQILFFFAIIFENPYMLITFELLFFLVPRRSLICANLPPYLRTADSPSPYPLPRGERDLESPSLDGRGKGEGDENITLRGVRLMVNICHCMDMSHANLTRVLISLFTWPTSVSLRHGTANPRRTCPI